MPYIAGERGSGSAASELFRNFLPRLLRGWCAARAGWRR